METRLKRWMNKLNMTYGNSYQLLLDEIHKFYEAQKEVGCTLTHPLSTSPSVFRNSEPLGDSVRAQKDTTRNSNGC
jgi:hypothetical protein